MPYLKKCLQLRPSHTSIIKSMAIVLNSIGNFDNAMHFFELLLDQDRTNATARTNLVPLYLRNMDWYYAEKFCRVNDLWWYNSTIENKKIVLDFSSKWNGLGDVMHIIRYAKHLHNAGAQVIVQVRKEMIPLLSLCPYIRHILPPDIEKPFCDKEFQITTDRCVLRMKDTLYYPSKDTPYLYANKTLIEAWKPTFWPDLQCKVGLCWQSTKMKDYFTNKIIPGPRAISADLLKPLLVTPNVSFYSLQKGEDAAIEKLRTENIPICSFEKFDSEGAFMDTAAIMHHLDLIITVDTSIAHLAGALGKPVWVLLPYAADFRWFGDRTDSPLYPTMRLFRQSEQGEWKSVIKAVKKELKLYLSQNKQNV